MRWLVTIHAGKRRMRARRRAVVTTRTDGGTAAVPNRILGMGVFADIVVTNCTVEAFVNGRLVHDLFVARRAPYLFLSRHRSSQSDPGDEDHTEDRCGESHGALPPMQLHLEARFLVEQLRQLQQIAALGQHLVSRKGMPA